MIFFRIIGGLAAFIVALWSVAQAIEYFLEKSPNWFISVTQWRRTHRRIFLALVFSLCTLVAIGVVVWGLPFFVSKTTDKGETTVSIKQPRTIKEHFENDFPEYMKIGNVATATHADGSPPAVIPWSVYYDFPKQAKFISLFVPDCDTTFGDCKFLTEYIHEFLEKVEKDVSTSELSPGDSDPIESKDVRFTGRVYIYHEGNLTVSEKGKLSDFYKERGMSVQLRGTDFAVAKWLQEIAESKK